MREYNFKYAQYRPATTGIARPIMEHDNPGLDFNPVVTSKNFSSNA